MTRKGCKPAAIKATQQVEEKAPQRRGGSPEVPRGQGVGAATRQGSQEPGLGVGEGGETRVSGEKIGQESRGGAESKGTGVTRAVQVGEPGPGAEGANPGDTRGAHVGGDVETPGPFRRAAAP